MLVHCAAGKDRTGVVVALALAAVGVRREAIIADYVVTADRITEIMRRLRASPTYATALEGVTDESRKPQAMFLERVLEVLDSIATAGRWDGSRRRGSTRRCCAPASSPDDADRRRGPHGSPVTGALAARVNGWQVREGERSELKPCAQQRSRASHGLRAQRSRRVGIWHVGARQPGRGQLPTV